MALLPHALSSPYAFDNLAVFDCIACEFDVRIINDDSTGYFDAVTVPSPRKKEIRLPSRPVAVSVNGAETALYLLDERFCLNRPTVNVYERNYETYVTVIELEGAYVQFYSEGGAPELGGFRL